MAGAVRFADDRSARANQAASSATEAGGPSAPRHHKGEDSGTSMEEEPAEGESGKSAASSGDDPVVGAMGE